MEIIRKKISDIAYKTAANKSQVDSKILIDTLYYRLTIIRLGEEDNNAWWESNILGEVGRRNLEKFFPNTFSKQRYDIAHKIISEKENREIPERRFTTLFNFGYEFETEIFKPFINVISCSEEWKEVLLDIESIKDIKFNSSWAREFYNISKLPYENIIEKNVKELGSVSKTFYLNQVKFEDIIKSFLSIYDLGTIGNVAIPYYKRKMEI